jgi:uncharacterized damage-inducible protein DinB
MRRGASHISILFFAFLLGNSFAQELPSLDSIPQGFGAQLLKSQQPAVADTAPAPPPPVPLAASSSSVVSSSSVEVAYKFYEDYLDSIVVFAQSILPEKQKLEAQKALVNAEALQPKTEYERQQDYDVRIANFNKEKQEKINNLEKEYKEGEKKRMEELKEIVNHKADFQPEWAGILKQDSTPEGYAERINRLANKISAMEKRTMQAAEILASLDALSKEDLETLDKKNETYLARLSMAKELVQDYILQEQARVLRTEKKKVDMVLGAYNAENQEFDFTMNDTASQMVPFDYVGKVKISPQNAQAIDRKTDDFTVILDYINYPFVLSDQKVYPGTKKAYVFYKDQEFPNTGVFRNVSGFENAPGYIEWALYADSIISGKLIARNLDSTYVMKKMFSKTEPVETFWDRNKNIVRGALLGLAAASAGIAIWQNCEASSKKNEIEKTFNNAEDALRNGDEGEYDHLKKSYDSGKKDLRSVENLRNGFYISAGVFGVAGVVSFFF